MVAASTSMGLKQSNIHDIVEIDIKNPANSYVRSASVTIFILLNRK
jgi:hypothetical protein